jgi:hypothetical protein
VILRIYFGTLLSVTALKHKSPLLFYSWLLYNVVVGNVAGVSKIHIASIFTVEFWRWKEHVSPKHRQYHPHAQGVTTPKHN